VPPAEADSAPSISRYYLDCTYLSRAPKCRKPKQPGRNSGRLLGTDADNGHHAAGFAEFGAMGKEACGVAAGAALDDADAVLANAGVLQLAAVGLYQVEVDFRAE